MGIFNWNRKGENLIEKCRLLIYIYDKNRSLESMWREKDLGGYIFKIFGRVWF